MAAIRSVQTNFTAGEVSPALLGRVDLRAYANGAATLRNVFIQPTGGVTRRPGLRHVATLPGAARLIAFEFNTEQTYLLVLTDGLLSVYRDDALLAAVAGPWTAAMLPQLAWTQSADTLLLCHPAMQTQRITRTADASWTVQGLVFTRQPFHRFVDPAVTLTASAASGSVTLTASGAAFAAAHVGTQFRIGGKRVLVTAVASATQATANVEETPVPTAATRDWDEAAFSAVHGWPVTMGFHQGRLVIGGSRDLPNRLWLSRSGDLFDFDLGTGLDDEAIEFGIVSDQVNAVRGLFSGRALQVFTSGSEWTVSGEPLTPASIQLNRQTRIGSPVARMVPPVEVDGSTLFVARNGRAVQELAYATTTIGAWQVNDLTLLVKHLIETPVALCYDQVGRLLHAAMADGTLATLTLYRTEEVTAWTAQQTDGAFRDLAEIEGTVWAVVERAGGFRLERFDAALSLDAALSGTASPAKVRWTGLDHLEGRTVGVLADGAPRDDETVAGGAITLDEEAGTVQAGLPFSHVIEPLPPALTLGAGVSAAPLRLVSVTFRLLETAALAVDLGQGAQPVPFRRLDTALLDAAPPAYSGDVMLRGLGWRRDAMRPLWRIEDDAPLPLTLLSVTTDARMND
ncbi:hypothetical protein M0638_08065 [Roseomonas sp. NAR14]|uniref:Uncharacterized protein n=1 Tax=Roseomonas acroporae TaxID=2937791 RepID=A0A9X2BUN9_9PROT|nr:hypothetical protein [Roseomonas acroporae]MCK8784331.1 hypothetical protein [Roseomonas acroporae]